MKLRKILSVILSVVMIAAWITVPVSADKGTVVYQKSGDWSIKGEHNYLWVTNDLGLESGKKYIIEFGVTVPTINSWPSFMFDWRDGSNNTKTNVGWNGYIGLTGFFNDGSNDCVCNAGEVWSGTVGREGGIVNYDYSILWDTATSKFDITIDYTTPGGTTGTITDTFTSSSAYNGGDVLKFWANGEAIVKDLTIYNYSEFVPTIYTEVNGWSLPVSDSGAQATELEDGRLQIDNTAIFKPTLEAGKKYSIKYDVTDLAIEAGSWTFPFRVKMTAGGVETDGILAYRMANVWEARNLVVASGTGTNEIIIDTKAKTWEAYALGSLSKYGTVESFDDFTLTFYRWGGPSACIGNVTVEDITSDEVFYEQNFDQIGAEFSNWKAATVAEVRATQPLQVWGGSFETTGEDKHLLSGSMDIYPLAVTPKTDKYELNFDIKPKAATDPNGSNWEGIVMQWNLGSSNSDSWHDMKLGTSAGANVAGEVTIDRLWIFGQQMVIDPTQWININVVYDCKSSTINAKASQGSTAVEATAPFTVNTSSLTGSPKITFEALKRNEVKYEGVYLDNIEIKKGYQPVIYTEANGWTVRDAVEQKDGTLMLSCGHDKAAIFKPNLDANKKYSITYDVTGLGTGDTWTYQFLVDLMTATQEASTAISYRMAAEGRWNVVGNDKLVATGTNGKNEIIIDMETGNWETYALGNLSQSGTFTDTSDFAIHFYKWGGSAPYISNVKIEEIRKNVIYTEANGWTLPVSDSGAQATELEDGRLQLNNQVFFKPTLEAGKRYSIKFNVTGLETGSDGWAYQFRLALIAGSTTLDGSLSYRQEGIWENGNESKYVAGGTDGEVEVIIDTATGEYEMYALGNLSASGTFTSTSDFTLKMYKWSGNAPYISNVSVEEVRENVIYTEANGWELPIGSSNEQAIELEDGRLQIDNKAIFRPTLEAGKKYSIKYDVTDLAIESGSWTFPFRVKMTAGGVETDGILAYRMANIWEARSLAIAYGTGTNEIIIDTKAKTWEAYALGSLSTYGTVESFDDFALTFYKWGGPSACIGNVVVEEIVFNGTYYQQNFDQIGTEFSNWRAATVAEIRATQPLQIWGGSFETTGEDKHLLSGSMDIYPLAVTPKTDKYELNFDIKPKAATDPNGSNWEGIVMQWNLGSSNSDSWHDMKLGTSAGANVAGEVAIDRLWLFGKEMTIDPTQWINVNIMYDCKSNTINAKVSQGSTVVTAEAPFAVDASSLTGSPKITFEGLKRNEVKYEGVYLDNIEINIVGDNEAPVLNANSTKIYAGDVEQQAANASAFTNKIEVIFGQVMWTEDMSMENIYVVDANGNKVTGNGISSSYDNDTFTITFENGFRGNQTYTVVVEKVRNIEGVYTLEVYRKSFFVVSGVHAELVNVTQNGNVIEDAANLLAGNVKININYSNTEDVTPVMHIVVAYYKNGKLVFADYFDKTADANVTSTKYALDYDIKALPEGSCDELQIMIWDGFDTIKPLSAPLTL